MFNVVQEVLADLKSAQRYSTEQTHARDYYSCTFQLYSNTLSRYLWVGRLRHCWEKRTIDLPMKTLGTYTLTRSSTPFFAAYFGTLTRPV